MSCQFKIPEPRISTDSGSLYFVTVSDKGLVIQGMPATIGSLFVCMRAPQNRLNVLRKSLGLTSNIDYSSRDADVSGGIGDTDAGHGTLEMNVESSSGM